MKRAELLASVILAGVACSDAPTELVPAEISLVPVATLGGSMEESSPHPVARISLRTSDGDTSYWASPTYEPGVLHGYGLNGTIQARLGGPGEGSGELGGLSRFSVQWVGDQAYVAPGSFPRLTIFGPGPGIETTETLPWPVLHITATPDGDVLLVPWGQDQTPRVRRPSGNMEAVNLPPGFDQVIQGGIALGRAEAPRVGWLADIWSGDVYAVDENLSAEYRFSVAHPDSAAGATYAAIASLTEHDGVLWICMLRRMDEIPSGAAFGPSMPDSIFDTQVVALDVATGERLGTYEDPRMLQPVWSEVGVFYSHNFQTEIGDTRVGVYRAVLGGNRAR